MVDTARALLDELMGRNRDLDPSAKTKVNWDDPEYCQYHLVKFCPHDLFVNTKVDLGPCPKRHDDEAKRMYEQARAGARKRQYEDDFLKFCNDMIYEVDRKKQKGRERLLLMSRGEGGPTYVSKFQEQLNNFNARIKKLLSEVEEAGNRGDVDQAQDLMALCEQLKNEKDAIVKAHDTNAGTMNSIKAVASTSAVNSSPTHSVVSNVASWTAELSTQEKKMEVCEVCGALLIVGDAQQRIEDHFTGRQHLGYSRLREAVEEMRAKRQKEREDEERQREEEWNKINKYRKDRDRNRKDKTRDDHKKRGGGYERDSDRRDRGKSYRDTDSRNNESHRRSNTRDRYKRERDSRRRSRSHSRSHK